MQDEFDERNSGIANTYSEPSEGSGFYISDSDASCFDGKRRMRGKKTNQD
jgi:hypothetical protein